MNAEQEALVLSVRPLAIYIASRMRRVPPLEIEDLAQAGLAQLCAKIDAFHERGPFAPWAGTVMGNAMRRENQSMTWRRQAKEIEGRAVQASGVVGLLIEHGHAVAIVGDSGGYDATHGKGRSVRAPAGLPAGGLGLRTPRKRRTPQLS